MILRLAQSEKRPIQYPVLKSERPKEPRPEPDQIEELVHILEAGEPGPCRSSWASAQGPQLEEVSSEAVISGAQHHYLLCIMAFTRVNKKYCAPMERTTKIINHTMVPATSLFLALCNP